jgi:hypothetical protein
VTRSDDGDVRDGIGVLSVRYGRLVYAFIAVSAYGDPIDQVRPMVDGYASQTIP